MLESDPRIGEVADQRESGNEVDGTGRVHLGKECSTRLLLGFAERLGGEVLDSLSRRLVSWNDGNVDAKAAGKQINTYPANLTPFVGL